MKSFLIALLLVLSVTLTRASITNAWLYENGDGRMACTYTWSPGSPLALVGTQYSTASAGLWGGVATDTPTDPTLALSESINNDTGVAWTDYHAVITMGKFFSFSSITVTNAGWSYSIEPFTTVGTNTIGTIDFFSGTPVAPGGELGISFNLTFIGAVNFNETLTPSFVPEPATMGLATVGGLLLFITRSRRKR
jgi:hypothetical protein